MSVILVRSGTSVRAGHKERDQTGMRRIFMLTLAVLVTVSGPLALGLTTPIVSATTFKYHSFDVCSTSSSCQEGSDGPDVLVAFVALGPSSDTVTGCVRPDSGVDNVILEEVVVTFEDGTTTNLPMSTSCNGVTFFHDLHGRVTRVDSFGDDEPTATTTTSVTASTTTTRPLSTTTAARVTVPATSTTDPQATTTTRAGVSSLPTALAAVPVTVVALAATGSSTAGPLRLALVLLALGSAALVISHRRYLAKHGRRG